jgi:exo-beta-1,3-glucanase (GH17 family)
MGAIDPNSIADDDDDSAQSGHQPKRRSFIPFVNNNSSSRQDIAPAATGVGAAAAAGGAFAFGTRDPSGNYATVPSNGARDYAADNGVYTGPAGEKSEWLKSQKSGSKRLRWIVGIIIALVIIGAIVGGVLGAVLSRKNNKSSSDGGNDSTPETVANDNKSDLDNNSAEIKKLFNNADLHKVFPGMDYTPLNMQYPECLSVPPSQNNVTRDMAVLSQLTNVVRLYGTDCNVTEMVLHSIDRLKLTDMKVWLGVWLDSNQTTNDRQLAQFWNTIEKHKDHATDLFKGVIVGNEVLFRKDLTITELAKTLADVKKNLTDMNIDLPVATSDLGDNWTAALVVDVDVVMSNIHPFFAGATAEAAAGWTWSFWQNKDVVLTKGTTTQQVISEVGWPSAGGNNCSPNECTTKTEGSIAGIDEMNTFMEHWVCQSLANSTEYFW